MEDNLILTIKNCNLGNEVLLYLQHLLGEIERDDENISFTQLLLQLNVLFVLSHEFFCVIDKKILKRLLDANKKVIALFILELLL